MYPEEELKSLVRANVKGRSIPNMLLRVSARSEELRGSLLSFVDVLPSLTSNREIYEYLEMYLGPVKEDLPSVLRFGMNLKNVPGGRKAVGALTNWLISEKLAPHFIIQDSEKLKNIHSNYLKEGADVVVDILGESVVSFKEADEYMEKYLKLITSPPVASQDGNPFHIAVKFSSLYPHFHPTRFEESKRVVGERFHILLEEAKKNNVYLTVDAENYDVCHLIEDIFLEAVYKQEFFHYRNLGIALQVYRKDALESVNKFIGAASTRIVPFGIRLIKGAYWDTELINSKDRNWPFPLFEQKQMTDDAFSDISNRILIGSRIDVAFGTHNPKSIAQALSAIESLKPRRTNQEFQVLYGLGEPIRKTLCQLDIPCRVYAPIGDIKRGMAYFARRILENTSNQGFMLELIKRR